MIVESGEYPPRDAPRCRPKVQITNNDPRMVDVMVDLENRDLWYEFHKNGTEMILTKSGRRMFPDLKFKITGLEANQYYFVLIDIVPTDEYRYKYMGKHWVPAYKTDAPAHKLNLYCHPDSPALGAKWLSTTVAFPKLKLTNSSASTDTHMVLNSMHRYTPRLHVFLGSDIARLDARNFTTFIFPETSFMAVTAYQNEEVTNLKIKYNPFAKGFRDDDRRQTTKRSADDAGMNEDQDSTETKSVREDAASSSPETPCSSSPDTAIQTASSKGDLQLVPVPHPSLPQMTPMQLDLQLRMPYDPRYWPASNSVWRDLLHMHSHSFRPWVAHGPTHVASPLFPYYPSGIGYPSL
ncbi:T-box transcription factor TBX3-like [Galendromus occidentalis]|uniref:T-box transcription factor TBX3-like n=1 Tax=Galendromus occidentalis TaxID=34638 RepID=A0AAJ7L7U8_9ACAR|nr:T-box transcription factor TBX3-like [Galendromus occidentalis]